MKKKANIKNIVKAKINFTQEKKQTKPVLVKKLDVVNKQKNSMQQEYRDSVEKKHSKQDRAFVSGNENFSKSENGFPVAGKYGKLLFDNFNQLNLDDVYNINKNIDYDVIIITGSYNRFEMLYNQLKKFFNQKTRYTFKFIVLNDGSDDPRYDSLKIQFPSIIYLKNTTSNGKKKYWKTITDLLQEAKNYKAHAILQIDDDFDLCESFVDRIMDLFFIKKRENNKILGISYHLYGEKHINENRWGCDNGSWADGGCLYDYVFFEKSGFKINEMPEIRWKTPISSGVWEQVSRSINYIGCLIYKTPVSYVNHEGITWGSMERLNKTKDNKAITYRFIDYE